MVQACYFFARAYNCVGDDDMLSDPLKEISDEHLLMSVQSINNIQEHVDWNQDAGEQPLVTVAGKSADEYFQSVLMFRYLVCGYLFDDPVVDLHLKSNHK